MERRGFVGDDDANVSLTVIFFIIDCFQPKQEGNEVYFKIKRSTPLRKLMDAYCQRQSKSADSIRFLYDGQRVLPDSTPEEVRRATRINPQDLALLTSPPLQMEMEDNDIIDAGASPP